MNSHKAAVHLISLGLPILVDLPRHFSPPSPSSPSPSDISLFWLDLSLLSQNFSLSAAAAASPSLTAASVTSGEEGKVNLQEDLFQTYSLDDLFKRFFSDFIKPVSI